MTDNRTTDAPAGWRQPLGAPTRFVAAALLLVTATAHALVIEDQFERTALLGTLYAVVVAGGAGCAVLLCRRDTRVAWLLTGFLGELGATVFVLTRLVRLPEVTDDVGRWTGPLAVLALVVDLGAFGLAAWAVSRSRPSRTWRASRMPLVSGLVALQVGAVATFGVASLPVGVTPARAETPDAYWSTVAGSGLPAGTTRTSYISSDEVVWDYAPTGRDQITGKPFDGTSRTYVANGPHRIGSKYVKCLYRGYRDATFTTPVERPASEAYLGLMGPVIHAAVGDTIKVVFRNTCALRTSVHCHVNDHLTAGMITRYQVLP